MSSARVCLDARVVGFAGIGRFIVGLWKGMLAEDADLTVLVTAQARVDHLGTEAAYTRPGPAVSVPWTPFLPMEQLGLPRLLRRHSIDVYHSPQLTMPYLSRLPTVLTVHDLFAYKDPSIARSRAAGLYYRTAFPLAVRRATLVVGGSAYATQELRDILRVPEHKLRTVDYGLEHDKWHRPPPDVIDEVLERLGITGPYILYVGHAKPHKNLITLLRAYARRDDLPQLVLAGPTVDEVLAGAPRAPLDGVRVLGRMADADLPSLYAGAQFSVLPSLYESVGFTALESMACGTPVITSDGGGLPTTTGDAGIIVPVADDIAWGDAMAKLAEDAELRATFAERGQQRVEARSWERAAREYLDIYGEAASR